MPATAAKKTRTLRIVTPICRRTGCGIIQITETSARGKCTVDTYQITTAGRYEAGTEATVEKVTTGDTYTCLLSRGVATCNCRGHQRWNRCRHASALAMLQSRGQLAVPASRPVLPLDW